MTLRAVPISIAAANRVVTAIHRHHGPCPPALAHFAVGAVSEGVLRGVAIAGRPANRNSDDGMTCEVLRVAADGTEHVPSFLLGVCGRVAKELGFARVLTYTLDEEPGTSLRAAGWTLEEVGIESWWHRYPTKNAIDRRTVVERSHHGKTKRRWARSLNGSVEWANPFLPDLPLLGVEA